MASGCKIQSWKSQMSWNLSNNKDFFASTDLPNIGVTFMFQPQKISPCPNQSITFEPNPVAPGFCLFPFECSWQKIWVNWVNIDI